MPIPIRRTLLIGLGGTGINAILRAKKRYQQVLGEIPPVVGFLGIDTDYPPQDLGGDEHVHMYMYHVNEQLRKMGRMTDFFPGQNQGKRNRIVTGAGQLRSFGRLALIRNHREVSERIGGKIQDITYWPSEVQSTYVATNRQVQIIVCFSLGGGTGSGTFIDLPFIINGANEDKIDYEIKAVALLPDIFRQSQDKTSTHYTYPSAATALTEYEFIAEGELHNLTEEQSRARIIEYGEGPTAYYSIYPEYLYNRFYLIDNQEPKAQFTYTRLDEMHEFLGNVVYSMSGAQAQVQDGQNDNLDNIQEEPVYGKNRRYRGIGMAEITLDQKALRDYYSSCYMLKLLNDLNAQPEDLLSEDDVDQKLEQWEIREDNARGFNQVIDALLNKTPENSFGNIDEFNKGASETIHKKADGYLQEVRNDASNKATQALDGLKETKQADIRNFISDTLNEPTPGRIRYLYTFLDKMEARINSFIDEMAREKGDFQNKKDEENRNTIKQNIKDTEDTTYFIPGKKSNAIKAECDDYVDKVNLQAIHILEIQRRDSAIEFYNSVIALIQQYKGQNGSQNEGILGRVLQHLNTLSERASTEMQNLKNRPDIEPFNISLDAKLMNQISTGEVDHQHFLNNVNLVQAVNEDKDQSSWYRVLWEYVNSLEKPNEYGNLKVLDALGYLSYDEKTEFIRLLDTLSRPLWDVNTSTNDFDMGNLFLVGVGDTEHPEIKSIFNQNDEETKGSEAFGHLLKTQLPGDKRPNFSSIPDQDRITVLRENVAAPCFAVKGVNTYLNDLNNKEDENQDKVNFYSNVHWEEAINRGFSIKPVNQENAVLAWALGFVFGKIKREGSGQPYQVHSKRYGESIEDNWVPLETSRYWSFNLFSNNPDYKDEILKYVSNELTRNYKYYEDLFEEIRKNGSKEYLNKYANLHISNGVLKSPNYEQTKDLLDKELDALINVSLKTLG